MHAFEPMPFYAILLHCGIHVSDVTAIIDISHDLLSHNPALWLTKCKIQNRTHEV